jgi:sugar phosphate isomerase/epimerase
MGKKNITSLVGREKNMKLSCVDAITPGITFREKFEILEKYGFDGIEIWAMEDDDLKERAKEINDAANSYKVKPSSVVVSGPASVSPLDNEEAAKTRGKLIKDSLKIAADINAVTFFAVEEGPQSVVPIFEKPTPNEFEKKLLLDLVRDVGKYAEEVGAILTLEPVNRYENHFFNTVESAIEICVEVGIENVKIMVDTCELNIEEKNINETIEKAGDYIYHVHLAENNRLLPGFGHIDFKSIFTSLRKIQYKRYMALECAVPGNAEEELPKCVKYLKKCMK